MLADKINTKLRKKLNREFSGAVNLRINKDLHKKLVHLADIMGCSLNMLIESNLEILVEERKDIDGI